MTKRRREPHWVGPFLLALERTGEARTAARDAGIDHTTAYVRRKGHGEFASRWKEALAARSARVKAAEAAEVEAVSDGRMPPLPNPSPAKGRGVSGAELIVSGGKVRRAGKERWSERREAIFFEELAATANATMAAEAAGVSTNAVFARRLKHPLFASKWEAVVRTARASIDLYLIEETRRTFDPATLDTEEVRPRVTIDQAIRISQLGGSGKQGEPLRDPFGGRTAVAVPYDIEDVRKRLDAKLKSINECDRREKLAAGWSLDEDHDMLIPPGYVREPGWRPEGPE